MIMRTLKRYNTIMDGKIICEGKTKDGINYLIRYIKDGDAEEMCCYINALSKEGTYVRWQGEEMTLEEEEKFVREELERIEKHEAVMHIVVANNKVVGIAGIDMKDKVEEHEGVLGISLTKE